MYVLPVSSTATVPATFAKYSADPSDPLSLPADQIGAAAARPGSTSGRAPSSGDRRAGVRLRGAVPLAFLAVLFVYPVGAIIGRGLHPAGHWQLGVVRDVLTDPYYRHVAWFTLWQAAASTVLTVLVALPVAGVFARFEFRGRRLLWSLLLVPFVLPTVVVGAAFLALLGPRAAARGRPARHHLARAHRPRVLQPRRGRAHGRRPLGSPRPGAGGRGPHARRVTVASLPGGRRCPCWRPAIAAASSIVFLFCFTSFGVVLLLGGPRARTLEVEIYTQTARLLHLDVAAVLALVQLVGVGTALLLYARHQRRRSIAQVLRPRSEVARRPRTAGERLLVAAVLALLAVLDRAAPRPAGLAVVRDGHRTRPDLLAGAGLEPSGEHAVRVAGPGRHQLADDGRGGHGGRARHRRHGCVGRGPARRWPLGGLVRRRARCSPSARRR